jgi:hypothetical protein
MNDPRIRAIGATALFSLMGLVSFLWFAPVNAFSVPHAIFYLLLVSNTYFSVKCFASITPPLLSQIIIDGVLIFIYAATAATIGWSLLFPLAVAVLFGVATIKYVLLLGTIRHERLLRRKVGIDLMGTLFALAIFSAAQFGYELAAAWLFACVFLLANIYLLLIKPMYRMDG